MASVTGDRAYLTGEGQWAYLQYEGDPTNQEAEVEGVEWVEWVEYMAL